MERNVIGDQTWNQMGISAKNKQIRDLLEISLKIMYNLIFRFFVCKIWIVVEVKHGKKWDRDKTWKQIGISEKKNTNSKYRWNFTQKHV